MRNISPCEIQTPICIWVGEVIHRYTFDRDIISNSIAEYSNYYYYGKMVTKYLDNHI